jgi:periplasmic divalent cation tolerance protein
MDTEAIVVIIATGSPEEAERVVQVLLEAKLAACVNLVSGVTSMYWWQGRIEQAEEVLLLAKTRRSLFARLVETVRAVHSYEVFEAVALPIDAGSPEYLRWVDESTRLLGGPE